MKKVSIIGLTMASALLFGCDNKTEETAATDTTVEATAVEKAAEEKTAVEAVAD
ncbi:MAG: hypothetical protein HOM11_07465, partial [Methylococcales bacterium]|nr:hypothetical protein [Methylococcales bacterium]